MKEVAEMSWFKSTFCDSGKTDGKGPRKPRRPRFDCAVPMPHLWVSPDLWLVNEQDDPEPPNKPEESGPPVPLAT